ncbi:hypothetical protein Tco_0446722 [Tanacetum coccineum]
MLVWCGMFVEGLGSLDAREVRRGERNENHDDRRDSLKRYMVWHAGQVYEVSGDEGSIDTQRCEGASNWVDTIEARIDADAQLAERLQAEEREQMSVEEGARLQMEFIAARKKFFAAKELKSKGMNHLPKQNKERNCVNDFVPMDTESSRKKAVGKKRAEDKMYYHIIRADRSTKYYKIFSAMLDDFDRQDVLDLYRLVKERFESTSLEGYDRLLWGDLITLFEPSEEDEI